VTGARPLSWVVAGGGTGGHVTPALALAERVRARGDRVHLLGSSQGLETRLVPAAGFELTALPSRQIAGRSAAARLLAAPGMARACLAAWRELGRRRADLVVSVGGYASVPAVLAAAARRLPVALVEPNAIPGRANRLAARFAARVFVHFEEAAAFLPAAARARLRPVGIPLRQGLVDAFAEAPPRRPPSPPYRLLVFGGSQGARQLNEALAAAAPRLAELGVTVFHQSGEADRERVERAYAAAGVSATVVAFEPEMPRRYRWADVAVCRAGALTVAELALAGLPALLVPYPYAADDHQRANARALETAGAARLLDSRAFGPETVLGALSELLAAPEALLRMGEAASKAARPRAAETIVAECAELVLGPVRGREGA